MNLTTPDNETIKRRKRMTMEQPSELEQKNVEVEGLKSDIKRLLKTIEDLEEQVRTKDKRIEILIKTIRDFARSQ